MKKLLGIVVLGLLWCEVSFALTQQQAINQYLSDRKLEIAEGVWMNTRHGGIYVLYKQGGNNFTVQIIQHKKFSSGTATSILTKGSTSVYYGRQLIWYADSYGNLKRTAWCNSSVLTLTDKNTFRQICEAEGGTVDTTYSRIWPDDINSHNAKFEKKKEPKKKKDKFIPSSGTAFFVTQKGHLITNFHVVEGCKGKSKIFYQDNEVKAKLLGKDQYLDLALLKADIQNKHFIKISKKSPKKLQRIVAAGYPFGKELSDDLKFTSGIVSSLKGLQDDSTRIQIDAALNYGNSGGPIVDEKTGELVAVAVAGLSKQVTESINFGIKAGSVKNFLDSNQINTSLTASKYSFGSVDLSDILEKATVYTFCK